MVAGIVKAEVADISQLCGYLDGTMEGLPEGLGEMPREIAEELEKEVAKVSELSKSSVIPAEGLCGVIMCTVEMAFLMGRRVGKLEASCGHDVRDLSSLVRHA